jgi:TetR/AcrR family transcriptional regulator, tetracycline repressor protein
MSGTRPRLTRDRIIAAAVDILDQDGTDALTMRRLGARLGVDPMAVYHHVPNKAAVFDGVVEWLWSQADLGEPTGTWKEQSASFMRGFRRTLLTHPHAVPIVGTRPVVTPVMLDLLERVLGLLTEVGLPPASAVDLMNSLAAFTIGHALAEVGEPVGGSSASAEQVYRGLSTTTHPHLAALFTSGYEYRPDEQFDRGLLAILDGWPNS